MFITSATSLLPVSWKLSTVSTVIYVLIGIFGGLFILFTIWYAMCVKKKTNKFKTPAKAIALISGLFALLSVVACISYETAYRDAKAHGMVDDDILLGTMIHGLNNTPVEDTLPKNLDELKGKVVIYYRFDCMDCKAIYPELSEIVGNNPDVYWIASNSEQGKMLRETYPVDVVPSGIYIRIDDNNGQIPYAKYQLYEKTERTNEQGQYAVDENGNIIVDTIVDEMYINRLLFLLDEQR